MQVALGRSAEEEPADNAHVLSKYLRGQVCLLFTDKTEKVVLGHLQIKELILFQTLLSEVRTLGKMRSEKRLLKVSLACFLENKAHRKDHRRTPMSKILKITVLGRVQQSIQLLQLEGID